MIKAGRMAKRKVPSSGDPLLFFERLPNRARADNRPPRRHAMI